MSASDERLLELLPAIYRSRDAQANDVLRALLGVLQEQADALEADVDQLRDNWFIETCDEWVVPYIGDLLGVRNLLPDTGGGLSQRALVANVLAYRRGKGTAATVEQLARDMTAWPARAVEFFELLCSSQHSNHIRPSARTTLELRDSGALELLGGPFEDATHNADVRHIDTGRGRYNIGNVGVFLWRLQAYPVDRSPAIEVAPGRYRFNQAGHDGTLFNSPLTETAIAQKANEPNVAGPLRRLALQADLAAFRAHFAGVPIVDVPSNSLYYGPERGLQVVRDGRAVPPLDIAAADLSSWDTPPPGVTALLSGEPTPFPSLTSGTPEVAVTIGEEGPRITPLTSVPSSLDDARSALEKAIRRASRSAAFSGVRVHRLGDRLFLLPGVRGLQVTVEPTASDPTTASEMLLASPDSTQVHAVLSGPLYQFPQLVAALPEVEVEVAGSPPATAALTSTPATLTEAASVLQDAIRGAAGASAFTDVEVFTAAGRLVVIAGNGEVLGIRPTGADSTTARQLLLSSSIAIDPQLGRLAFALGDEPAGEVLVSYNFGFPGDIGGGPYDRRTTLTRGAPGFWLRSVSQQDPGADFASLNAALTAWADPGDGNSGDAIINITDNGAYSEQISIVAADGRSLALQAADGSRPRVRFLGSGGDLGQLAVQGGGEHAELTLDGLLLEGSVQVAAGALGRLNIRHCTLVPGRAFGADGAPSQPGAPSIVVADPSDALSLEISSSITGPIEAPPDLRALEVTDSIVDSPETDSLPVLLSGNLSPFPSLSSSSPRIAVTIGDEGPHIAVFSGIPAGLADARAMLAIAIRAAHRSPAFTEARVVSAGNRLFVLPGVPERVIIDAAGSDSTAAELRLDAHESHASSASLSRPLDPFPGLSAAQPKVTLTMGTEGPHEAVLSSAPATLAQARDTLQEAVQAAHSSPAFTACRVATVDDRLVVLPGAPHTEARFAPSPDDTTSVVELGLSGAGPAVAGGAGSAGPPSTFLTSTVLGEVRVRSLMLASESIFTATVTAERRQMGCVRFCFVAPGSIVPRRFNCQPSDEATTGRIVAVFTSLAYGQAGYAQLAQLCPEEITMGAADEGEMGAFHLLQQPRRMKNLRVSLDEYLRLGLEAGIFLAT